MSRTLRTVSMDRSPGTLRRRLDAAGLALWATAACNPIDDPQDTDSNASSSSDASTATATQGMTTSMDASGTSSADSTTSTVDPDSTGDPPQCMAPAHTPCDEGTESPFEAMGLGCRGEVAVETAQTGADLAIGVRTGFGQTRAFDPREGSSFAVLGTGLVGDLDMAPPMFDPPENPTHCNDDTDTRFDLGQTLPEPIDPTPVKGDCTADPTLVGTGDCSGSIEGPLTAGSSVNDYAELRMTAQVPPMVSSFSYDFVFGSTEYPFYLGSSFNDMYLAWLESEQWTGNISYDEMGTAISLNAEVFNFLDDGGDIPELAGTCLQQHAATGWLTTRAGVQGGEAITVVFAIFDASDSIIDSYVFLDDFAWSCDAVDEPVTEAVL